MPKQNSTLIAFVLDRSGSMMPMTNEVITGFNKLIEENKKLPGECLVTLAQFDDQYELNYNAKPLQEVPALTHETYRPRGWTRLYDAIGKTIDDVGQKLAALPEAERPDKVLVIIMTDGQENSSREYSGKRIHEMITHQREKYNWEFAFHGCNEAALKDAVQLGISAQTIVANAGGAIGTAQSFTHAITGSLSYRSNQGYTIK
jgi:uncharacterized protein YegL